MDEKWPFTVHRSIVGQYLLSPLLQNILACLVLTAFLPVMGLALSLGGAAPARAQSPKPALRAASKPQATKQEAAVSTWMIKQRHAAHRGLDVFISKNAVKIAGRDYTWGVVCKAPTWDAMCYSRRDRTTATVPYKMWSRDGFPGFSSGYDIDPPPKDCDLRQTNYMGLPVTLQRWEGESPKMAMMQEEQVGEKKCYYTLIFAKLDTAPQVKLLFTRFYEMPAVDGVPLRFSGSTERQNQMLITTEVKKGLCSPEVFAPPPHLKTVKSCQDVFINRGDVNKVNSLGDILGR